MLSAKRALPCLASALLIISTGCSTAMSQATSTPSNSSSASAPLWEWPLKFTAHDFSAACFNTQACSIVYNNFPHIKTDRPSPSIESYGRPLEKLFDSKYIAIRNFPPPAQVSWRAKDGTPLQAQVDMAEIFKDGLIRHRLKREEIANTTNMFTPDIILEVNDRTINVYMRARISTKEYQIPGNKYSKHRRDLIKVYSHTY